MRAEFARITTSDEAEASLLSLGLSHDVIQTAIREADAQDAHKDSREYDRGHRAISRWGHTLATLRRDLRRSDWSWETDDELRTVVSPDKALQVSVAAAQWGDAGPRTLAKGWHTIQAVMVNNQLWLPNVDGDPASGPAAMTTLILCIGRTVKRGEDDRTIQVTYQYELSAPNGVDGTGKKRRVVSWRYRCFKGSLACDRLTKPLRPDEMYDQDSIEGMDNLITRK